SPGGTLRQLPAGHPVFNHPNRIAQLPVTPALARQSNGQNAIAPLLLATEREGHISVLYSPYGMAGGWELSQSPYALGYQDSAALQMGENLLMYAVTQ
ncbi:MAG: DUF4159 domain-containing protein, partial [Kiritimatiellae bacterium]|nr:DUF4159 domain-containing protein [Kiritimatiellia bacterium]